MKSWVVVETDESVFEKMKYGRGRLVNGKSVLGGVERRWNKCFSECLRIERNKGCSLLLEFECYLVVQ